MRGDPVKRIYMDHMAAAPLHPAALEAMLPYLRDDHGNPQSPHAFGQKAAEGMETARQQLARLVNSDPGEIYFTSSGSEANNFAVKGLALANQKKGKHVVVSAVEHQSVLHSAASLERFGFRVTQVPVDKWGQVDADDVRKALGPETILVSVQLANSEVGTVEPVAEISAVCREKGVLVHTDAVAAVGNMPVDVRSLGVDSLSLAAAQFYGPKGAAALFLSKGTRILPFIDGGIQEGGRRAGTENVAGIVGMGAAAELAAARMEERMKQAASLRDRLVSGLLTAVDHVQLTGHPQKRLAHQASFCVEFIEGEAMLLSLDRKGIAASSGSACTSRALKASHVLLAMGFDHATAQGSLVFGLIEDNRSEDVDFLLEVFPPIVERLRQMSPLYSEQRQEKKK